MLYGEVYEKHDTRFSVHESIHWLKDDIESDDEIEKVHKFFKTCVNINVDGDIEINEVHEKQDMSEVCCHDSYYNCSWI